MLWSTCSLLWWNPCGKHFGDTQQKINPALEQRMMRKKMEGKSAYYTQERSSITAP